MGNDQQRELAIVQNLSVVEIGLSVPSKHLLAMSAIDCRLYSTIRFTFNLFRYLFLVTVCLFVVVVFVVVWPCVIIR